MIKPKEKQTIQCPSQKKKNLNHDQAKRKTEKEEE